MSQALMVYFVPPDEVFAALGCGDGELVAAILDEFAEDIEQYDRDFQTDDLELWGGPTAAGALTELINGPPSKDGDAAYLYTAVFQLICQYHGAWVGCNSFSSGCRVELLSRLDDILKAGGVPLSLSNLWCRIAPQVPPPWDHLLEFGHWSSDTMRAAITPLAQLLPSVADAEERAALEDVQDWLKMAETVPNSILVGFFG